MEKISKTINGTFLKGKNPAFCDKKELEESHLYEKMEEIEFLRSHEICNPETYSLLVKKMFSSMTRNTSKLGQVVWNSLFPDLFRKRQVDLKDIDEVAQKENVQRKTIEFHRSSVINFKAFQNIDIFSKRKCEKIKVWPKETKNLPKLFDEVKSKESDLLHRMQLDLLERETRRKKEKQRESLIAYDKEFQRLESARLHWNKTAKCLNSSVSNLVGQEFSSEKKVLTSKNQASSVLVGYKSAIFDLRHDEMSENTM